MSELLVPTNVDAIVLTRPQQVTGPMSDFEILPWFDTKRDHYSTVPYLASAINAAPFAEHTYWLDKGVHLHWSLPDGLTRGSTQRSAECPIRVGDLWFAAVPNRWLVRRRADPSVDTADRIWLVQSDYVHTVTDPYTGDVTPATHRPDARAIAYPRIGHQPGQAPYLYLGRQIMLNPEDLTPPEGTPPMYDVNRLSHYAAPLTALGHGDPSFAAHYPTCRSVFGLHDPHPAQDAQGNALTRTYDVFGWYDDAAHDPLAALMDAVDEDEDRARSLILSASDKDIRTALHDAPEAKLTPDQWRSAQFLAITRRFGWTTFPEARVPAPTNVVCHAQTTVLAGQTADPHRAEGQAADSPASDIGIGSTAAEAYAAYLMRNKSSTAMAVEDQNQLVQSLAATDLAHHALDLGPKLAEARHNEQFRALPGHAVWVIRPNEGTKDGTPGVTLPDALGDALHRLNALQRAYDQGVDQINGLRQELYADWVHYMRAAYPGGDTDPFTVDLDRLRDLIERTRLAPLEQMQARTGHLYFGEDAQGNQLVTEQYALPGPVQGVAQGEAIGDRLAPGEALIGVNIYAEDFVQGLQLIGSQGHNARFTSGGRKHEITLLPDERITVISGGVAQGDAGAGIARLMMETSFGRRFGPFGRNQTKLKRFRVTPPRGMVIAGFQGHLNPHLASLGFLFADPHGRAQDHSDTTAQAVVRQHGHVLDLLRRAGITDLVLGTTPGARFYEPNDPIIALGETVTTLTTRHGQDGLHSEDGLSDTDRKSSRGHHETFAFDLADGWRTELAELLAITTGTSRLPLGVFTHPLVQGGHLMWAGASVSENWHPLLVEWQAEVQPLAEGANHRTHAYAPDFVTRSQHLSEDVPELQVIRQAKTETYEYLSGRSIMNASAGRLLQKRLRDVPQHLSAGLATSEAPPIILPLGGFHDQLMMRNHELQLPIDDPVGLPAQKALAGRIRAAMGEYHPLAPTPQTPFHPIRSGDVILQRLRVIDSYGRTREWRPDRLHTTARMRADGDTIDRATLPLRLSQAARLGVRWLSATDDAVESNVHPETTPVCGWILANELDREVVLYANDGRMVGSVDTDGQWHPAPGDPNAPRTHRDIKDRHLAQFATWLCTAPRPELLVDAFLDTIEDMLDRIDPAHAATHQERAMLVSRPLALVRAQIDLEARHHVGQDQSWRALRARLMGAAPDTHGVEHVTFGVRLGEVNQLNDGLCGYWVDDAAGLAGTQFYTPTAHTGSTHDAIAGLNGAMLADFPVQVSFGAAPVMVTMLMDPMGVVHATTGILPTKSVALPLEQVKQQIARLRVTFATGPILTPRNTLEIPLPSEPGFSWSWLQHDGDAWHETPHHPTIRRDVFLAGFGKIGTALWDRLIKLGRLVPSDHAGAAHLMQVSPDADPARFDDLGLDPAMVERGLHTLAHAIEATKHEARLTDPVVARDGWLQLRSLPKPRPDPTAKTER